MPKQFIWLMTDTTRWDMLGCYGNPYMKTPNLDRLAKEGVLFEHAYTTQPVCGPARSSLFTGMYPHSNGSWGNSMPLGANVVTLGQRLSANGINCAYIGKWHLDGGDYFGNGECPDGWMDEYWYDMRCYLDELTTEDRVRSRKPSTVHDGVDESFTYGYRCMQRAIDFIEKYRDEDFFLVLSLDEPHHPYVCPEPFASMYRGYEWPKNPSHFDTLDDKPEYQQLWAGKNRFENRNELKINPELYLGCNSFADELLGHVINRSQELTPNAMVLFTSDHGDALQEHCISNKGPAIYDGIARIPLIIKGGAVGQSVPHVVSHIDLPATVMEYMDLPVPKCFEGCSLLSGIKRPETLYERPAFVEFNRYEIDHDGFGGLQLMRAIVTDTYKLALHLTDRDEMYDMQHDPYELHNLIDNDEHAKKRDELHDLLLKWMNDTRDPFRGYQWQARSWRSDKIKSWSVDGFTRQRENELDEKRQLDYDTGLTMKDASRKK